MITTIVFVDNVNNNNNNILCHLRVNSFLLNDAHHKSPGGRMRRALRHTMHLYSLHERDGKRRSVPARIPVSSPLYRETRQLQRTSQLSCCPSICPLQIRHLRPRLHSCKVTATGEETVNGAHPQCILCHSSTRAGPLSASPR